MNACRTEFANRKNKKRIRIVATNVRFAQGDRKRLGVRQVFNSALRIVCALPRRGSKAAIIAFCPMLVAASEAKRSR